MMMYLWRSFKGVCKLLKAISPLPVATQTISIGRKTGTQRAVELTSSPYRNTLAKKNMIMQSKEVKLNTNPNILVMRGIARYVKKKTK